MNSVPTLITIDSGRLIKGPLKRIATRKDNRKLSVQTIPNLMYYII